MKRSTEAGELARVAAGIRCETCFKFDWGTQECRATVPKLPKDPDGRHFPLVSVEDWCAQWVGENGARFVGELSPTVDRLLDKKRK